jgi:hypothetical protein
MAISLADPGGPIELFHETSAALKSVQGAAAGGGRGELVEEIARDVTTDAGQRKNPMGGFKPSKGASASIEILDELGGVNQVVTAKASPEDAAAVRQWLLDTAQAAANAAKEGGFMGFHAVRVSEGEKNMLDRLGTVLAAPPA